MNLLPPELRDSTRVSVLLRAFVIAGVTWWIYAPALRGDWLWDDTRLITENPVMREPDGLGKIWLQPWLSFEYYPLTSTLERLVWELGGGRPTAFHVTTLLLHIINALLVWRLFVKMNLRLAWWGGLLFAVHPVQVESVAWIAEMKNTLSLMLCLLAMCAWIDFERNSRQRDYVRALGLFVLAVLAKLTVVMFPVIILLYAWWRRGRVAMRDFKRAGPFFLAALAAGVITIASGIWHKMFHHVDAGVVPAGGAAARFVLAGTEFAFDFSKSVLPMRLLTMYPKWAVDPASPREYLPWVVLLGTSVWLLTRKEPWSRGFLFGLGFFLLNLLPCPGFIPAPNMGYAWVMDHFLYLPIIGLIGIVAAGMGNFEEKLSSFPRRLAVSATCTFVTLVLVLDSHAYAKLYVNQDRLWRHTLQFNPDAWTARNNFADALQREGHIAEAIAQYRVILRFDPAYADGHNNYGNALVDTGQMNAARAEYEEALRLRPDYAEPHNGLGNILTLSGKMSEAGAEYADAIKLKPEYPEALNGLGNVLLHNGQIPEAEAKFKQALEINPNYPEAHCNLGLVFAQTGRWPEAIEQFEIAQQLKPTDSRIPQILAALRAAKK